MFSKTILLSSLFLVSATLAHAGGPPPMYVVVDKVVIDTDHKVAQWVQIHGSFTRLEKIKDKAGKDIQVFSAPTQGFVHLSLPKDSNEKLTSELEDWKKAAGTGKAVAVGACGDAGALLTCAIHSSDKRDSKPDAEYTTGHLKVFGNLFASKDLAARTEVATLLQFVKERK